MNTAVADSPVRYDASPSTDTSDGAANVAAGTAAVPLLDAARIPEHVAIIMDGNGRWARGKGMPRLWGHQQGYRSLKHIVRAAGDMGIKALTLYAFSAENWKRPAREVEGLMKLIEAAARSEVRGLHENNVRMMFSGRREELPESLQRVMRENEAFTQANTGLTLNLCVNYGGRAEILDAAKRLVEMACRRELCADDVTPELFAQGLYTAGLPDPDLLIRTAGEMRVSNYLLWQIAYAEIWVTPTLWPDFRPEHLTDAIRDYQGRVRKFGAVL